MIQRENFKNLYLKEEDFIKIISLLLNIIKCYHLIQTDLFKVFKKNKFIFQIYQKLKNNQNKPIQVTYLIIEYAT